MLRLQPGRRALHRQRQVARRQPGQPAAGRGPRPAPTSWCAPRSTGSPPAPRWPAVMDGRDALLAVAMNGAPLPVAHGFPARMVVPGLYGYVSAMQVGHRHQGHHVRATTRPTGCQRGWSQQAPIKTESRIDVPNGSSVTAGRDPGGRGGLGAAQGHRRGGGAGGPRAVAAGPAGRGARHRHLAAVGVGLGRHAAAATSSRPAPPTRPATPRPRCRHRRSPTAPADTRASRCPSADASLPPRKRPADSLRPRVSH